MHPNPLPAAARQPDAIALPQAVLPTLFEAQVARTPDAVAAVYEGTELSYAELDARANRLARLLIARGIGPEQRVALALPRSLELVVAILAVMKAGAAYVPLDPAYPAERLAYMQTDAAPACLLTVAALAQRLPPGVPPLRLDAGELAAELAAASPLPPDDRDRRQPLRLGHPAYVIYTSGSTGWPKGVVVSHAGLADLAAGQIGRFAVAADSRVLQFASPSFDAAVSELCLALLSGGRLVLAPAARLLPGDALAQLVAEAGVTHATLPPSALAAMAPGSLPGVSTLVVAGEACPGRLAAAWSAGRRLINAYGPTETTVCASMSGPLAGDAPPPLGEPIRGMRLHLLDAALRPVADGEVGELYAAGAGLARGYLGRPELTAERFLPDPSGPPGGRMYRTGDQARREADGSLTFLGRVDQQVKIRGHRVEPAEVAARLAALPGVREAAVLMREDRPGQPLLVGYAVPAAETGFDAALLRGQLAELLPDYMVPAAVLALPALPLTPNGKLDRAALPAPDFAAGGVAAPRTPNEETLAGLFGEVLELGRVGIDQGFFDLGGHSLTATRLISRIRSIFGVELELDDVFATPTVAALAERLDQAPAARIRPTLPLRANRKPAPVA
ncbi:non-ribosomal peptide synthetase [Chitinimonas koreensis]|uniref:non-ribosomal peptide synthetase n=1 Tax=Chitinimonas koreensis TaxID=356302 RepID=UPI0003FD0332|nr:non-ribosomal peptide synthetase [Chitinimonas koreensis]QNM96588.1 non-ribosomal peptide synthetase [Chitinimonas koreensis]